METLTLKHPFFECIWPLFLQMQKFTFNYKGTSWQAETEHYSSNVYNRYRIYLSDGRIFVISPYRMGVANDLFIWIQINEPGEALLPEDFLQTIGEALEAAGIY